MVTPSLLRNLLDQPGLDAARFLGKRLRYVLLEGEVVPASLVADFGAAFKDSTTRLVNYYSTWESLDVACETLFDPSDPAASAAALAPRNARRSTGFSGAGRTSSDVATAAQSASARVALC